MKAKIAKPSPELQNAFASLAKLPPVKILKEKDRQPDNMDVALATLASVEQMAYSGLTASHIATYLRSVVLAASAWQVNGEGALPHPLDPCTSPMLDALIGKRPDGNKACVRPSGSRRSVPINQKPGRKPKA